MSLVSTVGRRSGAMHLVYALVYGALLLGALTILYPVGLMLSTSVRSNADATALSLWPGYLADDWELFRKYLVEKDATSELASQYGYDDWRLPSDIRREQLRQVVGGLGAEQLQAIADDWRLFLKECPDEFKVSSFNWTRDKDYSVVGVRRDYQHWIESKFGHDIAAYNLHATDTARSFNDVLPPFQDPVSRRWVPPDSPAYGLWAEFLRTRPAHQLKIATLESYLVGYLTRRYFTLENINTHCGTRFSGLSQVKWDDLTGGTMRLAESERESILRKAPLLYVRLRDNPRTRAAWAEHLQSEAARFGTGMEPAQFPFSTVVPRKGASAVAVFSRFVETTCPSDEITFWSPLSQYQKMLVRRHGSLESINAAHGSRWDRVDDIRFPYPGVDYGHFVGATGSLRWTFLTGNYGMVFEHLAVRGRVLWVTIALVVMSVVGALIVNPLAAYALSRFPLSYSHGILVFFLATMAFPASVTMIPGFLLMKDLNLLNTLWALVLPSLANGYSIFLLKGFFDSLPPEIYEAASMEGAGELRMFWSITLPMCKPILAVIALGTFTASYGSFMFAFLTCQDPKWWTIMVFLYEFQQTYSLPLVMASLVAASIPTLLVFLACQNVILRGIAVPSFK